MHQSEHLDRKPHQGREDLIGEHRWGDVCQLILLVVFLGVWIADAFFIHYSTFLADLIPAYVQIPLALIFFVISGYLSYSGLRIIFGEIREKPEVIRKGVFNRVRHPIYLGAILAYLGWIIAGPSLLAAGVWLIIIFFYHFLARYEEKLLLNHFGQAYADYIKEVPMWIPKI